MSTEREINQLRARISTLEANLGIESHKLRMVQMENRLLRRRLWHLLKSSPAPTPIATPINE